MAVRIPLYYDNSEGVSNPNLRQMTSLQIEEIKDAFKQMYFESPSVSLAVIGSSGNLGTMYDTRLKAGAVSVGTSAFPAESVTQEPQLVQIGLSRIQQNISTDSAPNNSGNIEYPVYHYEDESGNTILRSMTLQDMYDTFVKDIIDDELSVGGAVYTVDSNTTISGYTAVSDGSTIVPIYTDTRANTSAYNASEIPETDDNTTITYYYLHKKNHTTPAYESPARITRLGNIITPSLSTWNIVFKSIIRYMVANIEGYKLRYSINGSGLINGTQMTDTRLSGGAGTYATYQAGVDDYRAQEFPDGSPITINTYGLYVTQE